MRPIPSSRSAVLFPRTGSHEMASRQRPSARVEPATQLRRDQYSGKRSGTLLRPSAPARRNADRRTQAPRHLHQNRVSDVVPVAIVHFFEIVGINQVKNQIARVRVTI